MNPASPSLPVGNARDHPLLSDDAISFEKLSKTIFFLPTLSLCFSDMSQPFPNKTTLRYKMDHSGSRPHSPVPSSYAPHTTASTTTASSSSTQKATGTVQDQGAPLPTTISEPEVSFCFCVFSGPRILNAENNSCVCLLFVYQSSVASKSLAETKK